LPLLHRENRRAHREPLKAFLVDWSSGTDRLCCQQIRRARIPANPCGRAAGHKRHQSNVSASGGHRTPIANSARAGRGVTSAARQEAEEYFQKVALVTPQEASRVIIKGVLANKTAC